MLPTPEQIRATLKKKPVFQTGLTNFEKKPAAAQSPAKGLPSTKDIMRTMSGKRPAPLPKPPTPSPKGPMAKSQVLPRGEWSISDTQIRDAPRKVREGLERLAMYDTEGNVIPSEIQNIFKPQPSGIAQSTAQQTDEGSATILPRMATEEFDVYDKALGGVTEAPSRLVAEGLMRLGITPGTLREVAEKPIEGLSQKLTQIFESGIGKTGVAGEKLAGPLAFTAGMIADPFNVPSSAGKVTLKAAARAIQLAQKGENAAPEILNILKKAGIEADEAAVQQFLQADIATIESSLAEMGAAKGVKGDETGGKGGEKPEAFAGFDDLTTKILTDLKGKTTVSKQYLLDASNRPELKQAERDLVRKLLESEGDTVNAKQFAEKMHAGLLPVTRGKALGYEIEEGIDAQGRYENTALPSNLRGPIANYSEHIYESPVKTSAGNVHFSGALRRGEDPQNYFAHSRVEDVAVGENTITGKDLDGNPIYDMADQSDGTGGTRRVIEIQSDLFQKGRMDSHVGAPNPKQYMEMQLAQDAFVDMAQRQKFIDDWTKKAQAYEADIARLEPYRNTWHERVIREEVKQAAADGKTKLQFPTGETAMKIEGLGRGDVWGLRNAETDRLFSAGEIDDYPRVQPDELEAGARLIRNEGEDEWIVTDVLGNGRFKAIPKSRIPESDIQRIKDGTKSGTLDNAMNFEETFDASGNIDTENPIYRFYEKTVGRYLAKNYGAKVVTDPQGVKWMEVDVKPGMANAPVEAFGAAAGVQTDEEGNITFDPAMAAAGFAGLSVARNPNVIKKIAGEKNWLEVAETLRDNFAKLPQSIIDAFAKRLAGLKKTPDIEAMLSTMTRLDAQAGQAVLENTPIPLRDVITRKQSEMNLDLLTRDLSKSDDQGKLLAVSENEYDELWRSIDEKAIERFNELNIERSIMEEVMGASRGKELARLYQGTFLSPRDYSLGEFMEQMKGKRKGKDGQPKKYDSDIDEIMGGDVDRAQDELDAYLDNKARMEDIKQQIKELGPVVKSSQMVRGILEGLPVVTTKEAKELDGLVNSATVRDFKDISGFQAYTRDPDRNFEHFFGRYYPHFKRLLLDPLDDGKRIFVDGKDARRDEIKAGVTDKFKINRGSPEDAAIQDWGERELMNEKATANPDSVYHTREALEEKFGIVRAGEIMKAEHWFRPTYDKAIDEANDVLKKIYPNDPSKLIPYRKDYFHHFQEVGDGFMDAIRNFLEVPGGIDPRLVGVSEFTTPKQKFKAFAQTRTGPRSERSAIEGYMRFMEGVEYLKAIEPHISRFRYLRRKIAEVAPRAGTENMAGEKQKGAAHFLWFLDQFANNLSGKTSPFDRILQEVVPGGRPAMRLMDFISNRIKANTMLGNAGTSLAQLANIPATIAQTKKYAVPGFKRTIAGIFDPSAISRESTFLRERNASSYKAEFPIDFASRPFRRTEEEVAKVLSWMLHVGDKIGSEFAWNSFLEKYLAQNREIKEGVEVWKTGSMDEAMRFADQQVKRLVAGRGVGELPIMQREKTIQAAMPFTIEANNAWHWLAERGRQKEFGAIATFLLAQYLYNASMEKMRGSRVSYDPINAIIEGSDTFMQEYEAGSPGVGAMKFAGRQAGEAITNVGGGQLVTSFLGDTIFGVQKKDLFGQGDPNRFGPPLLLAGAVENVPDFLARLGPPMAGVQIQKFFKGLNSMLEGQVRSQTSGKPSFPVARTPENIFRSLVFGPYSTTEARQSFDAADKLRTGLSIQERTNAQRGLDAEKMWSDLKEMSPEERATAWKKMVAEDEEMAKKVKKISTDEKKGIGANDRLLLMYNVGNGARARYVADQINSLSSKEEKEALWNEYVQKKIITKEVRRQLLEILSE